MPIFEPISEKMSAETLLDLLPLAFGEACGVRPSRTPEVLSRWHQVAEHVLRGTSEKSDVPHLAIELHGVYIGSYHKTEIRDFPKSSPAVLG